MKNVFLGGVAAALILGTVPAMADWNLTTGVNLNSLGPQYIIDFAANGGVSTFLNPVYAGVNPGPYDGSDDSYIGVINQTSHAIFSFSLSNPSASQFIGGFDGDGITAYGVDFAAIGVDSTGYGGHDAFFTNLDSIASSLTVNFSGGISAGGTDVFSLEAPAALNGGVIGTPEPATWAMMLLGFAGLGFAGYRSARKTAVAV